MSRIEDALRKLEEERRIGGRGREYRAVGPAVGANRGSALVPFNLELAVHRLDLNAASLQGWGPVVMSSGDERGKREYGQIKRPIINQALGRTADPAAGGNVVVVTSALAGEGKSLTALNLAFSAAREKDLSVLLIDADVAKPDLSRTLGLARSTGLTDLVSNDDLQFSDVVWRTSVARLFFVPVGLARDSGAELLGSDRMRQVVEMFARDLSQTLVIIDSSPLLLTNESPVLVSIAGQTVLVVRANETPRSVVAEALSRLDSAKPIGLVLNAADSDDVPYYATDTYGGSSEGESASSAISPTPSA